MSEDFIDYGKLIDDAMHIIVKKALQKVVKEGLPGKHHFFISFITSYPGVEISKRLKDKYPDEMTVVLQHQFDGLTVNDDGFSVILSFDNIKERIAIPFDALVAFADPSVKFGLQFRHEEEFDETIYEEDIQEIKELLSSEEAAKTEEPVKNSKGKDKDKKKDKKDTNVIDIDKFRKK